MNHQFFSDSCNWGVGHQEVYDTVCKIRRMRISRGEKLERIRKEVVNKILDGVGMPIDLPVRTLVTALLAMGFWTEQSCGGHTTGTRGEMLFPWVRLGLPEPIPKRPRKYPDYFPGFVLRMSKLETRLARYVAQFSQRGASWYKLLSIEVSDSGFIELVSNFRSFGKTKDSVSRARREMMKFGAFLVKCYLRGSRYSPR